MRATCTTFRSLRISLAAALLLGAVASSARAQGPWNRTWTPHGVRAAYRGVLVQPGDRFPQSAGSWIEVRINNFTTEREARAIVNLYGEQGHRGLRGVLGNRDIGTVRINGRLEQPLAAAWRTRDEDGEHLMLIVPRDPNVRELFDERLGRSPGYPGYRGYGAGYPYALIELDLREDGRGSGQLLAAASLSSGPDGGFDYQGLQPSPLRILHVERVDDRGYGGRYDRFGRTDDRYDRRFDR